MPPKEELLLKISHRLENLAQEYGVSTTTVCLWFKHYNIKKVRASKTNNITIKPTPDQLLAISHLPLKDIANQFNTSIFTVCKWLTEFNISKPHSGAKPSKQELEALSHLNRKQIAKIYNVTKQCVSLWTKNYNISFLKPPHHNAVSIPPKEELLDNTTIKQKALKYNASTTTVLKWYRHYNISIQNKPSKQTLESLSHLKFINIAKILSFSPQYISYLFKHYNIKR